MPKCNLFKNQGFSQFLPNALQGYGGWYDFLSNI